MTRPTVTGLATMPCFLLSSTANSASVQSGCARTSFSTKRSCFAVIFLGCPPPCGRGATSPLSRFRRSQRLTLARPTENRSATSAYVSPPRSYASTTRRRKSRDANEGIEKL
jgi:hypothetical protein